MSHVSRARTKKSLMGGVCTALPLPEPRMSHDTHTIKSVQIQMSHVSRTRTNKSFVGGVLTALPLPVYE